MTSTLTLNEIQIEEILRRGASFFLPFILCLACGPAAWSQQLPWSQRVANAAIERWPAEHFAMPDANGKQNYELATLLNGMDAVWYQTANRTYYEYAKTSVDQLVAADGTINNAGEKSPGDPALGRQLLLLYRVTLDAKYYKAAKRLHERLSTQARDAMAGPFHAEYASIFQEPQDFAGITKQFVLSDEHLRSQTAGAGDTGWYMASLVDSLPYYPKDDPGRATLLAILNRTAATVVSYQDRKTGLWYRVPDKPGDKADPFNSLAACLFTYSLQKGVRLGYLPQNYSDNAGRAWQGILNHFVPTDVKGDATVTGSEPEDVGEFLLASTEMELAPEASLARGQVVIGDAWFNSQQRMNAAGKEEYFHYKWDDYSDSGFSIFGNIFAGHGAQLETLYSAPTFERLKQAQYYIIVSPDIPVKNPHPNYMQAKDADEVEKWVKQGGVLILMENDPPNADIEHLNLIADRFGIHFNDVLSHHVVGNDLAAGRIAVNGDGPIFHSPHTLYMKDTCTLSLKNPAEALLKDKGDIVMAAAKYGKGSVFAVVDPWLYNEYTDGRKKLPVQDNYAAGKELVRWLFEARQHDIGSLTQQVKR
jgi:unsaturated rhamnogalacturonyl hydrolase